MSGIVSSAQKTSKSTCHSQQASTDKYEWPFSSECFLQNGLVEWMVTRRNGWDILRGFIIWRLWFLSNSTLAIQIWWRLIYWIKYCCWNLYLILFWDIWSYRQVKFLHTAHMLVWTEHDVCVVHIFVKDTIETFFKKWNSGFSQHDTKKDLTMDWLLFLRAIC